MRREIAVSGSVRTRLSKIFGVTERCIQDCLSYRRDNELHRKVRKAALENGGIDLTTAPTCECWHDADGKMIQEYINGARVIADKELGVAEVRDRKGHVVVRKKITSLSELNALQQTAQTL